MKRHVLWGALGFALFGIVSIGSTCDLESDQCSDSIDRCENNVAIDCYKPGEEVHAREVDTPCTGANDTCFLDPFGAPFCGHGPATSCPRPDTCSGDDVITTCVHAQDGGFAYVDDTCTASHCVVDTSFGADGGGVCK